MNKEQREEHALGQFRCANDYPIRYVPPGSKVGLQELLSRLVSDDMILDHLEEPDFQSQDRSVGIEEFQVTDKERSGDNGKPHNPTAKREAVVRSEVRETLESQGVSVAPDVAIHGRVDTGLSTHENQRYEWWLTHFKRVVKKHSRNVTKYRSKLRSDGIVVFLITDDAEPYIELAEGLDPFDQVVERGEEAPPADPHYWWRDSAFLDAIHDCDADFVIWQRPWQEVNCMSGDRRINMPRCAVYDVKALRKSTFGHDYDAKRMCPLNE